ncbi:protein ALP1-like [Aphis craccivora]|uniref:Protein ALP1-like n=1 Tax=Aphis craccivora TaxID=307492 RepID=A0A6G0Y777_APHCR|nr:protein ALP1-like [Aphis craccivora]
MVEKQSMSTSYFPEETTKEKLCDQLEKFFEYFRIKPETFEYILEKIEESITKFSNFRKCISAKQRLAVTISQVK